MEEDKKGNPYMNSLHNSIGKQCVVMDNLGKRHEGVIIGFNPMHLNIVINCKGAIRFIRNITWFEFQGGA